MTISLGQFSSGSGTGLAALSVATTGASIGDLVVLRIGYANNFMSLSSISGSNVAWDAGKRRRATTNSGGGYGVELWFGRVLTVATVSTAFTWSQTNSYATAATSLVLQSGLGQVASWAIDAAPTSVALSAATSITYPSATPYAAGEAYVGMVFGSGTPIAGSTAGYTYNQNTNWQTVDNAACGSGAQAPSSTTSSLTGVAQGTMISVNTGGAMFLMERRPR